MGGDCKERREEKLQLGCQNKHTNRKLEPSICKSERAIIIYSFICRIRALGSEFYIYAGKCIGLI